MFKKVLIANRGEIALRIERTLRELNIASVAVYSEADVSAPHVLAADEAVCVGPARASESYLNIKNILEAAKSTGAEAIHPGYGFLSENAAFVTACDKANIIFIGPTAESMTAMGDKSRAREHAEKASVPVVPGVAAHSDPKAIEKAARSLPLPVLLKAAAGGGGKGMRRVGDWSELKDAILAAQREGVASFGDDRLIVESYIHPVRHIEVQVLGDGEGKVVSLGIRECSLQRRHQKIIEESPSLAVPQKLRTDMSDAACRVASRVKYRGTGTVEFLVGADGSYYFLEMNTRLQVEHPVTELVTALDLVELQLLVSADEGIPFDQPDVKCMGHAIEARLYAENPDAEFLPTAGTILEIIWPHMPHVRIDSGVSKGQIVGVHYDPLLAKVIAWGETRDRASARLIAALEETVILGLRTNQSFLIDLLRSAPFISGETYTHTVEEWTKQRPDTHLEVAALAAAVTAMSASRTTNRTLSQAGRSNTDAFSPWQSVGPWRV